MKKIISLALALIMIASLAAVIAIPTSAADETPTTSYASYYTGKADTSWYENNPDATEYTLTSADQLAGLSDLVGNSYIQFKGVTIKLGVDIIWNPGKFTLDPATGEPLYDGKAAVAGENVFEYVPIGDRDCAQSIGTTIHKNSTAIMGQFYGSFDGQGHVISGLFYNHPEEAYVGMFTLFFGRELKNVSIVNSYFGGHSFSGSFAGFVVPTVASYDPVAAKYTGEIAMNFENLYSSAYVILKGSSGNATRSGGIFGMSRPITDNMFPDDNNPATNGYRIVLRNCWFDGSIMATHMSRDVGGIVGFACMDDTTSRHPDYTDNQLENIIELYDCLVTGEIHNVPESMSVSPNSEIRVGMIMGALFRGAGKLENCVAALRNTNISEDTEVLVVDPGTGISTPHKFKNENDRKGVIGYYENFPVDPTFVNVHFVKIGLFDEHNPILNPGKDAAGTAISANSYKVTGEPVANNNLAAVALAFQGLTSTIKFAEVDGTMVATIEGIRTVCDAADPSVTPPDPSKVTEESTTLPEVTPPPKTTTKKPDVTTVPATTPAPVTTAADNGEKSCGGFAAVGALLALVAVTGAAIVIKKK